MSLYITTADLEARYGAPEMTLLAGFGSDLSALIEDVCAEADDYLRAGQYVLPLEADAPASLKGRLCDIVRFRCYQETASETTTSRNAEALKFLAAIANGTLQLPLPKVDATVTDTQAVWFEAEPRVLTRKSLRGW